MTEAVIELEDEWGGFSDEAPDGHIQVPSISHVDGHTPRIKERNIKKPGKNKKTTKNGPAEGSLHSTSTDGNAFAALEELDDEALAARIDGMLI